MVLGIIFVQLQENVSMNWLFALFALFFHAQHTLVDPPYNAIEQAVQQADVTRIISFSKDKILLSVLAKESVCAQAQAVQILKDFFNKHPNCTFKFIVKSKESAESATAVGTLANKTEQFSVTFRWSKSGSELKIESIRIEKSN